MDVTQYKLLILDIPRELFNEPSEQRREFRALISGLKTRGVGVVLVVEHFDSEVAVLGYYGKTMITRRACLVRNILVDSAIIHSQNALTGNQILYLGAQNTGRKEAESNGARFINVGAGFNGLTAAISTVFGEHVVEKPNPPSKLPKVLIFDVSDTLIVESYCQYHPRSETLIPTLQILKAMGVQLFAVSGVADILTECGFPKDLIVPIVEMDKVRGVREVIVQTKIPPQEMLAFGDDSLDKCGATSNGVPFIKVSVDPDEKMQLETELAKVFGQNILGKLPVKEQPSTKSEPKEPPKKADKEPVPPKKTDREPVKDPTPKSVTSKSVLSDLPLPKPPEPIKVAKPGFFRRLLKRS